MQKRTPGSEMSYTVMFCSGYTQSYQVVKWHIHPVVGILTITQKV